jgi:outer membrane protein assembly factor BamE (lipoprotein component of BamABCDE complex)
MALTFKRTAALAAITAMALSSTACHKVRGYQGYVSDTVLIDGIQPGIDNRTSVEKTLGRPTFGGQFDSNDWYYVSRQTRRYEFNKPRASDTAVLRVRFDAAGNVASVSKSGLEKVASIDPVNDKTPTLGKKRGFFEDLFGNIGQVGSVGQGGSTADNPE